MDEEKDVDVEIDPDTGLEKIPSPVGESGVEIPKPDEQVSGDVDESGVPYKNRAKEFERKYLDEKEKRLQELEIVATKFKELESQIANTGSKSVETKDEVDTEIENFRKEMVDSGYYDEKTIDNQVRILTKLSEKNKLLSNQINEISIATQSVYTQDRKTILDEYEKQDEFGLVNKYRQEIESEIDKYVPRNVKVTPQIFEVVSGAVIKRHMKEILNPEKSLKDKETPPIETDIVGGKKSIAVSEDEIRKMASKINIEIETKEDKKKVIDAIIAERKLQETLKGK